MATFEQTFMFEKNLCCPFHACNYINFSSSVHFCHICSRKYALPPYFEANMGRWCLLRHLIYLVQTPLHVWHQQTFPKITNCELPTNISGWLVSTAGIAGRLDQITQEHIHCLFSNLWSYCLLYIPNQSPTTQSSPDDLMAYQWWHSMHNSHKKTGKHVVCTLLTLIAECLSARLLIGASLREPHTSESNGGFFIIYY